MTDESKQEFKQLSKVRYVLVDQFPIMATDWLKRRHKNGRAVAVSAREIVTDWIAHREDVEPEVRMGLKEAFVTVNQEPRWFFWLEGSQFDEPPYGLEGLVQVKVFEKYVRAKKDYTKAKPQIEENEDD